MNSKSDGTIRSGDSLYLEVEALYVLRKKKMIHLLAGDKIFAKYRVFSRRYYQIQRTFDSLSRYRRLIYSDKYGSLVCRALGLCQSKFRALVPLDLLTSTNRINYSLGRSRADRSRNKRDLEHGCLFYESALMKDFCFEEFETGKLSPWLPFLL